MRNSNLVYVLKMEYVPKINIFGLKMIVTIHHNFFFNPSMPKKGPFYYWNCNFATFYEVDSFNRKWLAHVGISK
jgi:hypothetical protein